MFNALRERRLIKAEADRERARIAWEAVDDSPDPKLTPAQSQRAGARFAPGLPVLALFFFLMQGLIKAMFPESVLPDLGNLGLFGSLYAVAWASIGLRWAVYHKKPHEPWPLVALSWGPLMVNFFLVMDAVTGPIVNDMSRIFRG